jgi:XTP/dITP diphosphohydrolase
VLVLVRSSGGFPEVFEGSCAGVILEQPRGSGGFGYDPLFLSDELGKTFGEASPEEKDRTSHRARALEQLVARLASPS